MTNKFIANNKNALRKSVNDVTLDNRFPDFCQYFAATQM